MNWNPRYVRYAEVHGKPPEEMLENDKIRWPGGCMCGFILWMGTAYRAYYNQYAIGSGNSNGVKGPLDLPFEPERGLACPTIDEFLKTYKEINQ